MPIKQVKAGAQCTQLNNPEPMQKARGQTLYMLSHTHLYHVQKSQPEATVCQQIYVNKSKVSKLNTYIEAFKADADIWEVTLGNIEICHFWYGVLLRTFFLHPESKK